MSKQTAEKELPVERAKARAEEVLENLMRDDRPIHEVLRDEGCTGVPEEGGDCPLYHYLLAHSLSDHPVTVWVDPYTIELRPASSREPTLHIEVAGTPLADFIIEFDDGEHPELVREGSDA